MTAKEIFRVA